MRRFTARPLLVGFVIAMLRPAGYRHRAEAARAQCRAQPQAGPCSLVRRAPGAEPGAAGPGPAPPAVA